MSDAPLQTLIITGVSPLASGAIDPGLIAGPVQTADGATLDRSAATDLTAFMNRALASVTINDLQGNALQPDVNYRGYTASPVLGTPQGLSVYLDGVRLNQPFGDVVSWDLIPRTAIASLTLMPGSNPLFGLNSLGGALSLRSKTGESDPGNSLQLSTGSHGLQVLELQSGGRADAWSWYLTGNQFKDQGWRQSSASLAKQLFATLGWREEATQWWLTAATADTDLSGDGLQEQRLLASDYRSVYTLPDSTANRSALLNLRRVQQLGEGLQLAAHAYYRSVHSSTLNGDLNANALGQSVYQPNATERAALAAAGYSGFPSSGESQANTAFPRWRCIANVLLNDEPNEKCNGLLNRTQTSQHNQGVSAQLSWTQDWGQRSNQLVLGAALDDSTSHFQQSAQFAYLQADHSVIPATGPGAFADGSQASESAFDARVDLSGRGRTTSAYFTDTLAVTPALQFTLSGRYDRIHIDNSDALNPTSGSGSLTASHTYSRFNPALGVLFRAKAALSLYAGYSQSSRAPSSIELGCADPAKPCRLPNAMAGDPPLAQVITGTYEAGLRGTLAPAVQWNAGVFRAENRDDILFVAAPESGYGYFRNFGRTQRQGVELGLGSRFGPWSFTAHYTLLDARFRSAEQVAAAGNSSNDAIAPGFEGNIAIAPGQAIPLTPRDIVKGSLQWDVNPRLSVDADAIYIGGSSARGNENGAHQADGVYYLGTGGTGGYTVVNLGADWHPLARLKLFVQVDNLLDRRYATASQLGVTGFDEAGRYVARPFAGPVINGERPLQYSTFLAPGAPRSYRVGFKLELSAAR